MDRATLLANLDYARSRALATLDTIEKSAQDHAKVLAWRPGPGRAHIGWQFMHLAATHDRYINTRLRGQSDRDPQLVASFGGGSTPSDTNIPTIPQIRQTLERHYNDLKEFVNSLSPADLQRITEFPNNTRRTIAESLIFLAWHETHHQGQIHITWNLYKAAHGIK